MNRRKMNSWLALSMAIMVALGAMTGCEKAPPPRPSPVPSPAPVSKLPEVKAIKTLAIADAREALNPNSTIWQGAAALSLAIATAPPVHPVIRGNVSATSLTVKAIQSQGTLFLYLEWRDKTQDMPKAETDAFSDAAAIQFPYDLKTTTSVVMGNPGQVNIWLWRAGDRVENLFAQGFGTLSPLLTQNVAGRGVYADGTWKIVLSRPLKVGPDAGVSLEGAKQVPIAFAVWDGANRERDGFKAVTLEWVLLEL